MHRTKLSVICIISILFCASTLFASIYETNGTYLRSNPNTDLIRGLVEFKREKSNLLTDSVQFSLKENVNLKNTNYGWSNVSGMYVWRPDAGLPESLALYFKVKSISTDQFNKLWIDYYDLFPNNPANLSLKIHGNGIDNNGNTTMIDLENYSMNLVRELYIDTDEWKAKDNMYLFKRLLNVSFDTDWYYIQEGKFLTIQRRFHDELSKFNIVDFEFKKDVNVFLIAFRFSSDSLLTKELIVNWDELRKEIIEEENCQKVRLWFEDDVLNRLLGKQKIFLKEIIVHLEGNATEVINKQKIQKIIFLSTKKNKDDLKYFKMTESSIGKQHKRLEVKLDDILQKQNYKQLVFTSGVLNINSSISTESSGIKINNVMAVDTGDKEVPVFAKKGESLSKRLGGPFFTSINNSDHVEWIKMFGYLPFQNMNSNVQISRLVFSDVTVTPINLARTEAMYLPDGSIQKIEFNTKDNQTVHHIFLSKDRFKANDELSIHKGNISIKSDGLIYRWNIDNTGLNLEGEGRRLEVIWPLDTIIEKNSYFFLNLSNGIELLDNVVMYIDFADGNTYVKYVIPNIPFGLSGLDGNVRSIRLKFSFIKKGFVITLADMSLFKPVNISYLEALTIPYPEWTTEQLLPEYILIPENTKIDDPQEGHLNGSIYNIGKSSDSITWTTKLNRKLKYIKGLNLNYKIPNDMPLHNACWLSLNFELNNVQIKRDICTTHPHGRVYLPIDSILDSKENSNANLIKWNFHLDNVPPVIDQPLTFTFYMSIDGLEVLSMADKISDTPILGINGIKYFPRINSIFAANGLVNGGRWMDFGKLNLQKLSILPNVEGTADLPILYSLFTVNESLAHAISVLGHPYLNVEGFTIDNRFKFQFLNGEKQTGSSEHNVSRANWLKRLLIIVVLIFAAIILIRSDFRRRLTWLWKRLLQMSALVTIQANESLKRADRRFSSYKIYNCFQKLYKNPLPSVTLWLILSILLYSMGLTVKINDSENYYFTFGSITAFLALLRVIIALRPWITRLKPSFSDVIYNESGNRYVLGFMLTLIATSLLLVFKFDIFAEQTATIGYYNLVAGVITKAVNSYKTGKNNIGKNQCE